MDCSKEFTWAAGDCGDMLRRAWIGEVAFLFFVGMGALEVHTSAWNGLTPGEHGLIAALVLVGLAGSAGWGAPAMLSFPKAYRLHHDGREVQGLVISVCNEEKPSKFSPLLEKHALRLTVEYEVDGRLFTLCQRMSPICYCRLCGKRLVQVRYLPAAPGVARIEG